MGTQWSSTTDTDLQRRIAVSKDYGALQGMITVGVGLSLILLVLTRNPTWLAIGCGVSVAVGVDWYQKRYGRVRESTGQIALALVLALAVGLIITIANALDHWQPGPLLWTPLVAGPLLLAGEWAGLRHTGLSRWHWVVCTLLTLCSLIPLFGLHPSRWLALGLLAPALIVVGLVDHQRLVRTLGTGAPE